MFKGLILSKINKIVANLSNGKNSIFVLKGIPLSVLDEDNANNINLEEAVANKALYIFTKVIGKRNFITYEEFLVLNNFVVDQYKTIYVLNNNLYMKQYPINIYFNDEIKSGLLTHFEQNDVGEEDDSYIGDIDEYISMFNGLREHNGYILGAYCDEKIQISSKIININIFEEKDFQIDIESEESTEFIDIIEEADYINLVKKVFEKRDEVKIRIANYSGDMSKLKEHIKLLAYHLQDWTKFYYIRPQKVKDEFKHRDEYTELLKKYWGYNEFRKLPIYDIEKLERGEKEIVFISQENIISNLVEQVENCADNTKNCRDVFVTASTGAGKSAMFQIPAIYIAEREEPLLTIVISPLIGLMNDQVKNLEIKNYKYAKTINSDISPILKQDIINKVANYEYHILYISPETLLSRSDVEQLIGDRKIGMIVIDEAHIVTTWGKQFRPDYWYLGDHIRKLRKRQLVKKNCSFIVATFTATAIYHGLEDMYTETINSLHMIQPITYLGYIKRTDINIKIDITKKEKGERYEYELDKFEQLVDVIKRAMVTNKKTLIYFPTVMLINRFYEYLRLRKMISQVTTYHGSLSKDTKRENYEAFLNKEKLIMLATKAFGMGIDIDDIELVVHFAPTGNVCDYVQEIGRAARRKDLLGEAYYNYNTRDFKHINRLHGLSTIRRYQLIEVIKKIVELYQNSIKKDNKGQYTRKRNAMLLDAENFTYIFGTPISDEDNNVNKVKTALLIIQKDFENKIGFSPINIRPIPLFSIGFFKIEKNVQKNLLRKYPESIEEIEEKEHICRVYLDKIWSTNYVNYSFPLFKYMIYSQNSELEFIRDYTLIPALCVSINFCSDFRSLFNSIWDTIKNFINKRVLSGEHTAVNDIANILTDTLKIGKYKAEAICEVVITSMDTYRKNFARSMTPIVKEKFTTSGDVKYQFNVAVNSYFNWVESGLRNVISETDFESGQLYLINDNGNKIKQYSVILGILEALDVLTFKMLGGANSQLYIYVNQIQSLENILKAPNNYKNRLLDTVAERHLISTEMLTYIYEGNFKNSEIWDLIEDYFLGKIPDKVKKECAKKNVIISE